MLYFRYVLRGGSAAARQPAGPPGAAVRSQWDRSTANSEAGYGYSVGSAQRLALLSPKVAGQLLTTARDNPDRLHSEAALAHLCGAAPIPASSGRTNRHRLNRGGDRHANHALHTIVLGRMRYQPHTRAYVARRTAEGLSKKEIIRCLMRYAVREVYTGLLADYRALTACDP